MKRKYKFVEVLMPTLHKISSYQFLLILLEGGNHEQSSQDNQSTWCLPHSLKYVGVFFPPQKSFSWEDKLFLQIQGGTNDQIHAKWGLGGVL